MHTIDIGKFKVRYRLPAGRRRPRRRLDRVLGLLLDNALENAVERAGIRTHEEICIRRLSRTVRLRLSATDQTMAEEWAQILTEAVRESASSTPSASRAHEGSVEMLRYPSRAQAMIDMVVSVSRGDLRRAWAWHQIGLWHAAAAASPSEALSRLVRALLREPAMIIAALRVLATLGLFENLARRLEASQWIALARAALHRRDLDLELKAERTTLPGAALKAASLVRTSLIARTLGSVPIPPTARMSAAALVLMEADPVLTLKPRDEILAIIAEVEALLPAVAPTPASGMNHARNGIAESRETNDVEENGIGLTDEPHDEKLRPRDFRERALTNYGGLLFLWTVLEQLDLPARLLEAFPNRRFSWVLHALGLALTPTISDDPAVLAFAGLPPDAPPPDRDEAEPSSVEREILTGFAQEIIARLQSLLPQLELIPEKLIEFVCARRAEIIAEPGWIEAHFSQDDASTDLRRAALDLDPGHISWLGVVAKFFYE